MFARILLPLDGSELGELSLPIGEELVKHLGSELILFHDCGLDHKQFERMHEIYLDTTADRLLSHLGQGPPKYGEAKVKVKIEEGSSFARIGSLVEKENIDLIIMTVAGASGHKAGTLGSVADQILRTVTVPVMLIRPRTVPRIEGKGQIINRILVPLDGSDLSKMAIPAAEELAARLKVPVALFQMVQVIYPYYGEPAPFVDYQKLTDDEEKRVQAEMALMEKELTEKGLSASSSITTGTDAAINIIEVAEKIGAGLVVMSTHGRSGLTRWLFGSVAEKVLRHIEIPLLLIHTKTGSNPV